MKTRILTATRLNALLGRIADTDSPLTTVDGRDLKDAYEEYADLVEELCERGDSSMMKELIYMRTELRALRKNDYYEAKKKCGRLFLHRQGARPYRRLFRIAQDAGRGVRYMFAAYGPAGRG